jgi:hypothetical protein
VASSAPAKFSLGLVFCRVARSAAEKPNKRAKKRGALQKFRWSMYPWAIAPCRTKAPAGRRKGESSGVGSRWAGDGRIGRRERTSKRKNNQKNQKRAKKEEKTRDKERRVLLREIH